MNLWVLTDRCGEDLVGGRVPDVAWGFSFPLVIQVRIEPTRPVIERWALRLIHFVVSSANHRPTKFSREL